ncbi:MAG: hypothetical protein AB7G17_04955 [Phycisphaerales bacterium]
MTGSTLLAESVDRPLAYSLLEHIQHALPPSSPLSPIVCSDIWWLNNDELAHQPTISLGPPDSNALSAFLARRLPSAFAIDGVLNILLDPEYPEPHACIFGATPDSTHAATEAFLQRHLEAFLNAALARA